MNKEIIETVIQLDADGNEWLVERADDYFILTYNGDINLLPDPYANTIFFEGATFEQYYELRDSLFRTSTIEIGNQIKSATSLLEQMIVDAPKQPPGTSYYDFN